MVQLTSASFPLLFAALLIGSQAGIKMFYISTHVLKRCETHDMTDINLIYAKLENLDCH